MTDSPRRRLMALLRHPAGQGALLMAWAAVIPPTVGTAIAFGLIRTLGGGGAQVLPVVSAVALAVGLSLAMGLVLIPSTVLALVGGYLLGWWAIPLMIPSYLMAVLLGYVVGKWLAPAGLIGWLSTNPRGAALLQRLESAGTAAVFWIRLSPVLPFGMTNLALAWSSVTIRQLLLGSLLGMLPRTALSVGVGRGAASIEAALAGGGGESPGVLAGLAALVIASALGLYSLWAKRKTPQPKPGGASDRPASG